MSLTDERLVRPADAVRSIPCEDCGTEAGLPCTPGGDHVSRWCAGFTAGLVSRDVMGAVFQAVLVITRYAVVPAGVV